MELERKIMSTKDFFIEDLNGVTWICLEGWSFSLPTKGIHRLKSKKALSANSSGDIASPMPGQVLSINVSVGQKVKKGDTLCAVEAMKMEHSLKSPFDGEVTEVFFQQGDTVSLGDLMLKLKKEKAE